MSKFLRTMTALSKKPSDFRKLPDENAQEGPAPAKDPLTSAETQTDTVPVFNTVPDSESTIGSDRHESATLPRATPRPRIRIFHATRVEHGHTIGEHLVYEVLWRNAVGNETERTIQIGYDRLAKLANVNWKTAKACLKGLEEKLAIETLAAENSNERTGKTYRVHSFTIILERRRNAGMDWVEKGRGVRFVESGTVPVFNTVPVLDTVPVSGTVSKSGTETVSESGTETVPVFNTLLGSIRNIEEITSSSSLAAIQDVTRKVGIVLDDDAARKLVRRCRAVRPDATECEIARFTELKINQLRKSRSVENWVGMLIAAVPVYFEGEAPELQAWRGHKAREAEQSRELARQILDDPDSPEESREWARATLELKAAE